MIVLSILSYVAAAKLGMIRDGTAAVEVVALPPYQTLTRAQPAAAVYTASAPSRPAPTAPASMAPAPTRPADNFSEAILAPAPQSIDRESTYGSGGKSSAPASFADIAYLQIGAFSLRQSAEALQHRLTRQLNYAVVLDSRYADLYKVRVGPIRSQPELNALQQRLADLGFYETSLIFE